MINRLRFRWRRLIDRPYGPLLLLLGVLFVIGIWIAGDYGQSYAEFYNLKAGARALGAYSPEEFLKDQNENYFHGTFYFLIFAAVSRITTSINPNWLAIDARHFVNFLVFLMGTASLYVIAMRLTSPRFALFPTLLFVTQPIYFGSSFINQKDAVFMSFFLVSVASGLVAAEAWGMPRAARPTQGMDSSQPERRYVRETLREDWLGSSNHERLLFILLTFSAIGIAFGLLTNLLILPNLLRQVTEAYRGQANAFVTRMFEQFAQDAYKTPLEHYLNKVRTLFYWLRFPLIAIALVPPVLVGLRIFNRTYDDHVKLRIHRYGPLLLSGVILGITSAVRVAGPFAGVLVGMYFLFRYRWRPLPGLALYGLAAAITVYLVWPALWGNPILAYSDRLLVSTDFGVHEVFFRGEFFNSNALPRRYLPELMALQFTEPLLILFPIGLILSAWAGIRRKLDGQLLVVLLIWFLLPFFLQIAFTINLYGNFRHLYFITPPIILIAGYAWMHMMGRLRSRIIQVLLATLILVPGMVHIIRYHPYEVVYYNAITGGVPGARDSYALGFSCTAYREAMQYVNEVAPEGALVYVWGPYYSAEPFARNDLHVRPEGGAKTPDYALNCGKGLRNPNFYASWDVVHTVSREGTILSEVKAPGNPETIGP